jgi:hypothetical protein
MLPLLEEGEDAREAPPDLAGFDQRFEKGGVGSVIDTGQGYRDVETGQQEGGIRLHHASGLQG